ncbi:hypothetical protein [Flavobacterium wongokense]|uniref:hypothetical protein n=1 Tax=Flavobacterium wongokense TaxID=2910674 RepID=UPI001F416C87|nr:hypothetical protein [Flavobacterium sp. WG47]MCF6131611.1 hypothetical protein [Flavobacterium sp. WG47]
MKSLLPFSFLICFGSSFAQDVCMKPELFDQSTNALMLKKGKSQLDHNTLKPDALQITVLPNDYVTFPEPWYKMRCNMDKGFKLFITNATTAPVEFWGRDSQKWAPIREVYYNNRWIPLVYERRIIECGNESHYKITLEPDSEIAFVVPCLEGSYLTKYRFTITSPITKQPIYSNEFDGYFDARMLDILKSEY